MNLSDTGISFVRTATPVIVGVLLTSALGPWLDPNLVPQVVAGFLSLVWYAAIRALEVAGIAQAGILLGWPKQPLYQLDTQVVAEATPDEDAA
jgi:hypothetical protein